jgi:hypothetical protein
MLLRAFEFQKNSTTEGLTVLRGVSEITYLHVPSNCVTFTVTERNWYSLCAAAAVRSHGVHHLQSQCFC